MALMLKTPPAASNKRLFDSETEHEFNASETRGETGFNMYRNEMNKLFAQQKIDFDKHLAARERRIILYIAALFLGTPIAIFGVFVIFFHCFAK